MLLLLLLLLRSNPSRQHLKLPYRCGVRRRGKAGKYKKVGVKRKWWGLGQPSYSPQENGRQSPRVELGGTDHLTQRRIQGAGIAEGCVIFGIVLWCYRIYHIYQ